MATKGALNDTQVKDEMEKMVNKKIKINMEKILYFIKNTC